MMVAGRISFHPFSLAPVELEDGGAFDYAEADGIFLGRKGWGPLRLGWDTNLLIDWGQYGKSILSALDQGIDSVPFPPESLPPDYQDDLIALLEIIRFWQTRDIRIRAFDRQLTDFRKSLKLRIKSDRERQVAEMSAALSHIGLDAEGIASWSAGSQKSWLPEMAMDDALIQDAYHAGCHVFLSRDKGVLRRSRHFRSIGLAVERPVDLLDALAIAGELRFVGVDGLVCDNHKWMHLRNAT